MKKFILNAEEIKLIESLRAAQKNEGSTQSAGNTGVITPKRARKGQGIYNVITPSRRTFERQLDKDGNTKRRCIAAELEKRASLYPDPLRFYVEFHTERERLMDSKSFCNDCKTLDLNPEYVADHVVFEGRSKLNLVLRDGLQALGEKVRMFNCPLWDDSENLFSAASSEASDE